MTSELVFLAISRSVLACFKESSHLPDICLPHSRILVAKHDSLIASPLTPPPLPKLSCFQQPIPDTSESVITHTVMSVIWLQWREPTQDLRILVGLIEGGVETSGDVAAVGIAIADVHGLCMGSLGHGVLYKVFIRG